MNNVRQQQLVTRFAQTRLSVMTAELHYALKQTERRDLRTWSAQAGRDFMRSSWNRLSNTGQLLKRVGKASFEEARDAVRAYHSRQLKSHLSQRGQSLSASTQDAYRRATETVGSLVSALKDNPGEAAPQLLTVVLTSVIVSGGADGNGGAPDLDLMLGIDAHRSLFSHSIIMGAALETGLLSLLHLTQLVHAKLPAQHDPLWDRLLQQSDSIIGAARTGVGVGMAYHLLVDGLAQPAAYKDLPVSMPIEAHQAVFVANGLAEATNAAKPVEQSRPTTHLNRLPKRN